MGDQFVRRIEDRLRRTVIPIQDDIFARIEVTREIEDDALVSPAPGIDGLVGVADNINRRAHGDQKVDQFILHVIRILVFVDEDVTKLPLVTLAHFGEVLEDLDRNQKKVIEVKRKHRALQLFVFGIDLEVFLLHRVGFLVNRDVLRIEALVLHLGDVMKGVFDKGIASFVSLFDAHVLHHFLQIVLVEDRKRRWVFDEIRIRAKEPRAEAMEGRYVKEGRLIRAELFDPGLHLVRGLVGKGNR